MHHMKHFYESIQILLCMIDNITCKILNFFLNNENDMPGSVYKWIFRIIPLCDGTLSKEAWFMQYLEKIWFQRPK